MAKLNSVFQHLTAKQGGNAQGRARRRRHCPYHKLQRKCIDLPAGIPSISFVMGLSFSLSFMVGKI